MGQKNTLLRTHQQSILAASVVKPNQDARVRVPSASSEKGTATGLLGLLSGVPLAHQSAFGSGDGVLIQGRPRARSAGNTRKKDASNKGKKRNEPSEAEDLIPPPPRKPSFPFQWAWESFLVDGRSLPLPSSNSSHQTQQPQGAPQKAQRAKTSALPPARAPQKSRLKAMPPSAQPANFPLYWKMEARSQDMKRQLKTWLHSELDSQESQDSQDYQDGQELEGSREDERGQLRKWKALHLAGFALLRGFQRKSAKSKDPEKLLDMEILQKHLQEDELYNSQWPIQDTTHPQGEKVQAWEDVKPFLTTGGTTRTFQMRREATRTLMLDWELHKREALAREGQRRAQELRVQKQVARCLAAYEHSKGSGATHRRLDELRRQEKQRLAEYQAELQGIHHRVQSRPFLFQQAMQANARLSVNRRFSQVLSALGLDEEQVLAEALKDEIEEIPFKHRSSKTRKLSRIRVEQPLWGME
ncbi:testis-specific protein 10-interacting protein isoform X2 [Notamacropus eugenii]|uniref:testis-specific protein 10-interacting protein isoform X2 n=1 Tax=Notamacropus eugenii TaxID=9315 RepID=UPI003B67FBD3